MKKSKNLESRSPEVQEIIGQIPHWLIRWGMTAVFFVIVILVSLAWFIRYPEKIDTPIKIKEVSGYSDAERGLFSNYRFIAEGLMNEKHFVGIKLGQEVHVKLTSYPFQEYGVLKGSVIAKSEPNDTRQFRILVGVIQGLRTSYDKDISYYPNMTGDAQIILRNPRLINRIFGRFRI